MNRSASDEEDEGDEYINEVSEVPRKIKSNQCNCDICVKMRVCLLNYHAFEPSDQMGVKFKNSIQVTCNKHKINI